MNVDIYVSAINPMKYLSVPAGEDLAALSLPSDPDLSTLNPFHLDQDIGAASGHVGLSADNMAVQIESQGYALQLRLPIVGKGGTRGG